MDRRLFLKSSGLFLLGHATFPLLFPRLLKDAFAGTLAPSSSSKKVIVVIFQRGAMDGLSMIPPLGDSHYNSTLRPSILLTEKGENTALPLDGFFGMHPDLKELLPFWSDGRLAVIHQVGSPNSTRSHFDAQDFMESGTPGVKSTEDGFLNRALLALPPQKQKQILQAIALQPNLARSLWGSSGAIAMNSLDSFSTIGPLAHSGLSSGFESMYAGALDQTLRGAGQETFQAIHTISALPSSTNASYPNSQLGKRLKEIAKLIHGQVGLRIAVTDSGGWDTHQRQGAAKGQLANRFQELSTSIAAFAKDLGPKMDDVCLVTMTEFGRTAKENGNGGTDHGHGSVMMVLGGSVRGKRVISKWKNLATENLFEGRDLPVTTDFRDVWAELLSHQLGVRKMDAVFPDYRVQQGLGLFRG